MPNYKITIVSDQNSWLNKYIPELIKQLNMYNVEWINDVNEIERGDFVFYLGCEQIVRRQILNLNKHNLVIHESNLPEGKGWSPLTWQIIEGKNEISICIFEAEESVDSGKIYIKNKMIFSGHELINELRQKQAEYTFKLILDFINKYPEIIHNGVEQSGKSTFYPQRTPKYSKIDINTSIKEQFNLLRVVDNDKYPAFFEINGQKYILKIEKAK